VVPGEKEGRMKQLFIAAAAAMALPAIAAVSATNSLAQSGLGGQAQRAAADVNMDAVPLLTPDSIRKVQQALQKKGINPGPIDGKFGPLTKQAVHNFQDRYGIKTTGDVDNQTLFALGEVDLAGD
jgi:peptidoglycan hydrolase-like protein with peptidoglycan-binding domain